MAKTPEQLYEERKKRVWDAVNLKVPDRVPVFLPISVFGAKYGGITVKEAFELENTAKWFDINEKLLLEYQPDFFLGPMGFDMETNAIVGNKLSRWPGSGVDENTSFQFVEGEYMKAEEYDAFLENPGDFILRTYMPRVYSGLEGLRYMPSLMSLFTGYGVFLFIAMPPVVEALENLTKAAKRGSQFMMSTVAFISRMQPHGFPPLVGFGSQAPFDMVSDYLRGLKGSTLDMFRCPDKLLAAQQKFLPYLIDSAIAMGRMMPGTLSFCFLHRGSDEFMSPKQFETFYWPGLKTLLLAMIDAGLTPLVFWEGSWNQRLEYLRELPKGRVVGWFDRTDLFKAKEVIGDTMCICGDMPLSLLIAGTPEQIKDYAKKLIDVVGKDGGFIMGSNTVLDYAKPELVKVWVDFTREYGVYR
jgi:uroporphyrinogen-III decarboxylase